MEATIKIVNAGLAGEPEKIMFQNIQTNTLYEFSQVEGETINNGDLSHPIIQRIVHNGFLVNATINENETIILNF